MQPWMTHCWDNLLVHERAATSTSEQQQLRRTRFTTSVGFTTITSRSCRQKTYGGACTFQMAAVAQCWQGPFSGASLLAAPQASLLHCLNSWDP